MLGQLKALLGRTGTLREDGFWIDHIKSHCYVTVSRRAPGGSVGLYGVSVMSQWGSMGSLRGLCGALWGSAGSLGGSMGG